MDNFVIRENEILSEFKESIADLMVHNLEDYTLLGFLRVAGMDKVKAKNILNEFINNKFRLTNTKDMGFKNYAPNEEVQNNLSFKIIGTDYENRFILWAPVGRYEVKKLLLKGLKTEIFLQHYKMYNELFYELIAQGKKTGKVYRVVVLIDCKELTLKKVSHFETIQVSVDIARITDTFAPLIDKAYIVNAPWAFQYLFALLKPALSSSSISKVEILSSDETKMNEALSKRIPANVLPIEYGGLGPKVLC